MYTIIAAWLSVFPLASAFYAFDPKWPTVGDKLRRESLPVDSYADAQPGSFTLPLRKTHSRRDNQYPIVPANAPKQANSAGIPQDGTDKSYMVEVAIGSQSKKYHLLLDSAASNTWVMGDNCKSEACGLHSTFGSADSATLKQSDTGFEIQYGTGSVSGHIATDTFRLSSFSPILQFGLATNVSDDFKSFPMDGIVGIARGDNTAGTIEAPSLMDVLSTQKLIGKKLVGIHLSRAADGPNDGELNFGEPNKERFDGQLNFGKAVENKEGFWKVTVEDTVVDGKPMGFGGREAIIDTGTSFILMPGPDAVALHKRFQGSSQSGETFSMPCNAKTVLQFVFNKVKYDISPKDYLGGDLGDGKCKSNIIGRKTFGERDWLVGDVFLKNVYAVFDFEEGRVGFGVKVKGNNGEASTTMTTKASSTTTSAIKDASSGTAAGSSAVVSTFSSEPSTTRPANSDATSLPPAAESQQTGADLSPTGKKSGAGRGYASSSFGLCVALLASLLS